MGQQEKDKNGMVPFDQLRLLLLFMAADGQNDKTAIKRIKLEAAELGIKFGFGYKTAMAMAAELLN